MDNIFDKRKLQRQANTIVRVKNPLPEDFILIYDSYEWKWRGGEVRDVPYYIASAFLDRFAKKQQVGAMDGVRQEFIDDLTKRKIRFNKDHHDDIARDQMRYSNIKPFLTEWGPKIILGKIEDYGDRDVIGEYKPVNNGEMDVHKIISDQINSSQDLTKNENTEEQITVD